MPNNETKLKHVTEHDGSKWVELEVAEGLYTCLEELIIDIKFKHGICLDNMIGVSTRHAIESAKTSLSKARGEQ